MEKFKIALKFALNIYIITAFITLLVLFTVNIVKKITER